PNALAGKYISGDDPYIFSIKIFKQAGNRSTNSGSVVFPILGLASADCNGTYRCKSSGKEQVSDIGHIFGLNGPYPVSLIDRVYLMDLHPYIGSGMRSVNLMKLDILHIVESTRTLS